jgi:hypothetical protein
MSVTLASRSIFDTFTKGTDRKVDALLHGHSYTAHPIGCEVARESLRVIGGMDARGEWRVDKEDWGVAEASSVVTTSSQTEQTPIAGIWSLWSREVVEELSKSDKVESTMAMGTVMVVHLKDAAGAGECLNGTTNSLIQLTIVRNPLLFAQATRPRRHNHSWTSYVFPLRCSKVILRYPHPHLNPRRLFCRSTSTLDRWAMSSTLCAP